MSTDATVALAWIGRPAPPGQTPQGQWGPPGSLSLPLDDRGLLLGDGLFETVLVAAGAPRLLAEHLERWRQGAFLLGLPEPPAATALTPLISEALQRSSLAWGALRLNWTRGGGGRGLDWPSRSDTPLEPRFWLQLSAWRPTFSPVRVMVCEGERRHPGNVTSRCKTLAYGWAVQARREARAAGADDGLVCNTAGDLCGATTANLVLRLGGVWLTPPATSGCLPGVMRGRALALGLIQEAPLPVPLLEEAEAGLLLNSLDCRPLTLGGAAACTPARQEARELWHLCAGLTPSLWEAEDPDVSNSLARRCDR
jgi:branched-subunit amino acid aminotransferase/4-amino-4-deoxychorismate lyase